MSGEICTAISEEKVTKPDRYARLKTKEHKYASLWRNVINFMDFFMYFKLLRIIVSYSFF